MEEKNYRSAFSCALAYVKNDEILKKYTDMFEKQNIQITSRANLQNCILFAGALFDENIGYEEKKAEKYSNFRAEVQADIVFTADHVKVIKKVMKDLANEIARKDAKSLPENIKKYQETYNVSKAIVDDIFNEELEARQKNFLNNL
jgi:hypothetical protein